MELVASLIFTTLLSLVHLITIALRCFRLFKYVDYF